MTSLIILIWRPRQNTCTCILLHHNVSEQRTLWLCENFISLSGIPCAKKLCSSKWCFPQINPILLCSEAILWQQLKSTEPLRDNCLRLDLMLLCTFRCFLRHDWGDSLVVLCHGHAQIGKVHKKGQAMFYPHLITPVDPEILAPVSLWRLPNPERLSFFSHTDLPVLCCVGQWRKLFANVKRLLWKEKAFSLSTKGNGASITQQTERSLMWKRLQTWKCSPCFLCHTKFPFTCVLTISLRTLFERKNELTFS